MTDGKFDLISAKLAIRYLRDPVKTCTALRKLLAPGGKIAFLESPASGWTDVMLSPDAIMKWEEIAVAAGFVDPKKTPISIPKVWNYRREDIVLCEATC